VGGSWSALNGGPTSGAISPFRAQTTPLNISQVKADSAWATSTGDDVKLLIIDSGVRSTNPDLSVHVAWRCLDGAVEDQVGHGTHVAGIATALDNSDYVVGVSHEAYLMSANVDVDGSPDPAEVACSIDVARDNDVQVVNLSLNFTSGYTSITDEINGGYYYDNMIFVGASGNTGGSSVRYPASLDRVVAVGAVDSTDTRDSDSNYGSALDLMAPGVNVLSTALPWGSACADGGAWVARCSGTSMAAPHVSGAAAIVWALYPSLSNSEVIQRLKDTALDLGTAGWDSQTGYGRIDVLAATALPPLSVEILGDEDVAPYEDCSWEANRSGGVPPFSYQWWGALSGSTTYVDGSLSESSYLWLAVTDSWSQTDTAQIFIAVDENYECEW